MTKKLKIHRPEEEDPESNSTVLADLEIAVRALKDAKTKAEASNGIRRILEVQTAVRIAGVLDPQTFEHVREDIRTELLVPIADKFSIGLDNANDERKAA